MGTGLDAAAAMEFMRATVVRTATVLSIGIARDVGTFIARGYFSLRSPHETRCPS